MYVTPPPLDGGEMVLSIGTGGGVPAKIDRGGLVEDVREGSMDYFVASSDTTRGSSGGAAFDAHLAVTGVLVRGGIDLAPTDAGCAATIHLADDAGVGEEFTYAHAAVRGLCDGGTSASYLCQPDCGSPCQVPAVRSDAAGGCSWGGTDGDERTGLAVAAAMIAVTVSRRRFCRSV
jgi:hypothetical protein